MKIAIEKIKLNPQQPRTVFNEDELKSLAASIKDHGLEQPVQVKENGDGTYTLVDGERRLRAHVMNGEKEIECFVKGNISDETATSLLISAMAANIGHDALHPVDEARGYKALKDAGMKIRDIAISCGTNQVNIFAKLPITKFTEEEQDLMKQDKLPCAKEALDALLSIKDQGVRIEMAKRLAEKNANVAVVIKACKSYIEVRKQVKKHKEKQGKEKTTPVTEYLEKENPEWDARHQTNTTEEENPDWDALFQVGKVPPWAIFTESMMKTCDACSLRPMASPETCGTCPLVVMVQHVLEKFNDTRNS